MKKNVLTRIICLVTATVVLSGAVAFAAVMGSPYDTLKNAAIDALTYGNVTIEANAVIYIDGVAVESPFLEVQQRQSHRLIAETGFINYYFDENGERIGQLFDTDGLKLSSPGYTGEDGVIWHHAGISPRGQYREYYESPRLYLTPEERESPRMRFWELLLDLVVGDLKNNLTMTSDAGGRTIRGTLTGNQLPEIVKTLFEVMLTPTHTYYYEHNTISFNDGVYIYEEIHLDGDTKTTAVWSVPYRLLEYTESFDMVSYKDYDGYDINWHLTQSLNNGVYVNTAPPGLISTHTSRATREDYAEKGPFAVPLTNFTLNYARLEAGIDASGKLTSINISGMANITDIFGHVSEIMAEVDVKLTDIGTTIVQNPIPGSESILNADYMNRRFGSGNVSVYFTLLPDGSINEDSITTTYPGEIDRELSNPFAVLDFQYRNIEDIERIIDDMVFPHIDVVENPVEGDE